LRLASADPGGGGVPPELLDTGAAALLPWPGAEVGAEVGVGDGVGDAVGAGVGAETVGAIVPRSTVTVVKEVTTAGPRFIAVSETELAFKDNPTLTPSAHRVTCTVYLVTDPLTALISQAEPVRLKSSEANPLTDSENCRPYSKLNALVGEAGELIETVGTVRSMTTSVLVTFAEGPATAPLTEFAVKLSRRLPTLQPEAVMR